MYYKLVKKIFHAIIKVTAVTTTNIRLVKHLNGVPYETGE